MEDEKIVALYWQRSETAIAETSQKYGAYCRAIAYNLLRDEQDAQECVNDTYWNAWNAMPPRRPGRLAAFLGKITRNLSLDRLRHNTAEKRGKGEAALALTELEECIPAADSTAGAAEEAELVQSIDRFLGGLSAQKRRVFLLRYWYAYSVPEIARGLCVSESQVTSQLFRTRNALKLHLEQEGITV